jgi:hypothetical protein
MEKNGNLNMNANANNIPPEDKFITRVLSIGDFFCENIKYNGYTVKSIVAIEDCDYIYLKEEFFEKIFATNINKFEKMKKGFILANIINLAELAFNRRDVFFSRIDTMVN